MALKGEKPQERWAVFGRRGFREEALKESGTARESSSPV
jgi:hypothetical protein